jgi:hypothetical protein
VIRPDLVDPVVFGATENGIVCAPLPDVLSVIHDSAELAVQ